jgi:hypothetical protein
MLSSNLTMQTDQYIQNMFDIKVCKTTSIFGGPPQGKTTAVNWACL